MQATADRLFNPAPGALMHIDLNSCFASVEQQANPLYRGRPLVVGAYTTDSGCILAASVEAKRLGIKTGMYVGEGKRLCPALIVLPSDPPKYRFVNRRLLALLQEYSANIQVKSIDEMVVDFKGAPRITGKKNMEEEIAGIAREIKGRIKEEIGEWLTVSVGIAPNRYLAKIASNLHKPDGLELITRDNIETILSTLALEDLSGIKAGYGGRLRRQGITTPLALYRSSEKSLRRAFASKIGYDWWLMLHGWESDLYNRDQTKSIGHSYALPKAYVPTDTGLHQILCQLVEKMGRRLREGGYTAQGIRISLVFADHTWWNHGEKLVQPLSSSRDLYRASMGILGKAPTNQVKLLAVSSYFLSDGSREQLGLFETPERSQALIRALDDISDKWGEFTVMPARMLSMEQKVLDRIAFGGVKGLEDTAFEEK